jgi:hypothetical protein
MTHLLCGATLAHAVPHGSHQFDSAPVTLMPSLMVTRASLADDATNVDGTIDVMVRIAGIEHACSSCRPIVAHHPA